MGTLKDAAIEYGEKIDENEFGLVSQSSVKIVKNSRGVNISVRVVVGEEHLIDGLKKKAIDTYLEIEKEIGVVDKGGEI